MFAVEMMDITKRFGTMVASNHVNFQLKQGEVHALLGENGAGKTTLMRILYGLYTADDGKIFVNGTEARITSPKIAIEHKIGMVTQHFTLVPTLTVAENVVLGYAKGITVNLPAIQKQVADAASRFGIEVDPTALVRHLSVGERQRVEILKSLYRNARVLILDEPTAVLVPQEVDALMETLNRLTKDGMSIIFITHKLNEVMTICDRITVLRAGNLVGTVEKSATTKPELAKMMVGREEFGVTRSSEAAVEGDVVLHVENVCALDKKGLESVKDVSLDVHAGQILGIAGVSGNGQSELARILDGTLKPTCGKVVVTGKDLTQASPSEFTKAGIGRIPEDRHAGLVGELSVADNLALEDLDSFTAGGMLDGQKILKNAETLIKEYQIKATPADAARTLSGGNMQKVILARALSRQPKVVLACQPTRGLDVGATDYVRSKLLEQRERGAGVLLISEDLDEILALCDCIAVMYEGKIVGKVATQDATVEQLGLMMSGAREAIHAAS